MTCQPRSAEFEVAHPQSIEDFAVIRSRWIDAFARFEAAICACLFRFDGAFETKNVPLSQRLSRLASLEPSSRLSKKAKDSLTEMAGSCQRLLTIRAAIVHSPMAYGELNGVAAALFQSAQHSVQKLPVYLVMTEADFEITQAEVARRTSKLDALLANPSSPPPPRPDATTAP